MNLKIISGSLKGRRFSVPKTDLRPTEEKIRGAFFNSLFSLINFEGRFFLDLFSGSGAIAFESISRGFVKSYAVEKNSKAAETINFNGTVLGINESVKVLTGDAFKPIIYGQVDNKINAVYIDPPYLLSAEIPNVIDMVLNLEIIDSVCVIGVESDREIRWSKSGWSGKQKKFGSTYLTFFYNWEKKDE